MRFKPFLFQTGSISRAENRLSKDHLSVKSFVFNTLTFSVSLITA